MEKNNWLPLYETAAKFRDLAPWRWMYDSQLFGVRHPETGETGWCSVMGNAGEHFALAVYRDAKGLESFFNLAATSEMESEYNPGRINAMFSQDCLMVSFEDANMVGPEQKAHLRALDLKFRGAGQWIVVQSYDQGLAPWIPDENELPYLNLCLEQALEVAIRCQKEPDLLDREETLVRVPVANGGALTWDDTFVDLETVPATPPPVPVKPSKAFLDKVKFLPEINGGVALATFFMLQGIQENKKKRPWHPMLLLCIHPGAGVILTQELAPFAEVPQKLEQFLLKTFQTIKGKPIQLGIHDYRAAFWLKEIAEKTGIQLIQISGDEPYLTEAVETLSGFGAF